MRYIYERHDWPKFHWKAETLLDMLTETRYRQGRLARLMEMPRSYIAKNGGCPNPSESRSSKAIRLNIDARGMSKPGQSVGGIENLMLDAIERYDQPLTEERLFGWQAGVFPDGLNDLGPVSTGAWRTSPMTIQSGSMGRERIHYEAPDAGRVPGEMEAFLNWFNTPSDTDWLIRAGIAHLWFLIIHPFEDGNGLVARAIMDMALARSRGSPKRFYDMPGQIRREHGDYESALMQAQRGTNDISQWLVWFLQCLGRSIDSACSEVLRRAEKDKFWESVQGLPINQRQRKIINILLDEPGRTLTEAKWARIAHCQPDMAQADIYALIELGLVERNPEGGRHPSYRLVGT